MAFKTILCAGVAAAAMFTPVSIGTAAANDTYSCNGSVCYDDQADETRALNNQALEQAERENDEGGAYAPGYPPSDAYQDDDDAAPNSYGDRGDMYGDDDDDDADSGPYDTNPAPYDDDTDDGDDD